MIDLEALRARLRASLPDDRFGHALRTAKTAVLLSARHGVDVQKAEIAGILHDCARGMDDDPARMLAMAARFGVTPSQSQLLDPALFLHAPLSAQVARQSFGIRDADILQAIARHTTCAVGMAPLDKVLYIADLTEPGRKGMESFLKAALADLDQGFFALFLHSLRNALENGWYLDEAAASVYNDILRHRPGQ